MNTPTPINPPRIDNPEPYLRSVPVKTRLGKTTNLLQRYQEYSEIASTIRNQTVTELSELGFTYAEIGDFLGVSVTRVKQLIDATQPHADDAPHPQHNDGLYPRYETLVGDPINAQSPYLGYTTPTEEQSPTPVFFTPHTLTTNENQTALVSIIGGTCTGKTTLTTRFYETTPNQATIIISTTGDYNPDNYHLVTPTTLPEGVFNPFFVHNTLDPVANTVLVLTLLLQSLGVRVAPEGVELLREVSTSGTTFPPASIEDCAYALSLVQTTLSEYYNDKIAELAQLPFAHTFTKKPDEDAFTIPDDKPTVIDLSSFRNTKLEEVTFHLAVLYATKTLRSARKHHGADYALLVVDEFPTITGLPPFSGDTREATPLEEDILYLARNIGDKQIPVVLVFNSYRKCTRHHPLTDNVSTLFGYSQAKYEQYPELSYKFRPLLPKLPETAKFQCVMFDSRGRTQTVQLEN